MSFCGKFSNPRTNSMLPKATVNVSCTKGLTGKNEVVNIRSVSGGRAGFLPQALRYEPACCRTQSFEHNSQCFHQNWLLRIDPRDGVYWYSYKRKDGVGKATWELGCSLLHLSVCNSALIAGDPMAKCTVSESLSYEGDSRQQWGRHHLIVAQDADAVG